MSHEFYQQPQEQPATFSLPADFQLSLHDLYDALANPIGEIATGSGKNETSMYIPIPGYIETAPPEEAPEVQREIPKSPEARYRRFMEMAVCPPEVEAEHRPKFDAAVAEAVAAAPSTHDKQSMQRTANILRWQLFGKPGDELPDGLVMTEAMDTTQPSFDTRKSFKAECASKSYATIMLSDAYPAVQAVTDAIKQQLRAAKPEVHAMVNDNPANALLRSFDAQGRPHTSEVPLDQQQRAIEEEKARRTTLQQFGMGDHVRAEEIERGSAVDNALRRAYWRIDDQTQQKQESQPHESALDRARQYFAERIADTYIGIRKQENRPGLLGRQEVMKLLHNTEIPHDSDEWNQRRWVLGYKHEVIEDELAAMGVDKSDPLGYEASRFTIQNSIERLFDSEDPGTYTRFIGALEDEVYETIVHNTTESYGAFSCYGPTNTFVAFRDQLLAPHGEFVEGAVLREAGARHLHRNESPGLMTQEEMNGARMQFVGSVREGDVASSRVIQTQERDPALPTTAGTCDLKLYLFDEQFTYADPDIPGYTLVGRNAAGVYEFTHDDADPYVSADVPLGDSATQSLAQEYQRIGLRRLADRIKSHPGLTVEQLRSYIQRESDYPRPTDADVVCDPFSAPCVTLDQFGQFVDNGRLQVQCTGASQFLKMSLQKAFGDNSSEVISGISIQPTATVINALGHQQTAFTHDGKQYILDATPGAVTTPLAGQAPDVAGARLQQLPQPAADIRALNGSPKTTSEQTQAIRSNFEKQLSIALKAPDQQALYEHVAKLPETTDPVRRTMALAMQATSEKGVSHVEADALVDFLDNFKKLTPAELRGFGLPQYEDKLLDLLSASAQAIAHTVSISVYIGPPHA